ncbi:NUDIX domain-containing protein [Tessaracoccus sp.]
MCVGLVRKERMLVVRTGRYPNVWQPVGGGIEAGETAPVAAVREVLEETGWALTTSELTVTAQYPMDADPGTLTFYLASAPEGDLVVENGELLEHRWVDWAGLGDLPAFPAAQQFYALWPTMTGPGRR